MLPSLLLLLWLILLGLDFAIQAVSACPPRDPRTRRELPLSPEIREKIMENHHITDQHVMWYFLRHGGAKKLSHQIMKGKAMAHLVGQHPTEFTGKQIKRALEIARTLPDNYLASVDEQNWLWASWDAMAISPPPFTESSLELECMVQSERCIENKLLCKKTTDLCKHERNDFFCKQMSSVCTDEQEETAKRFCDSAKTACSVLSDSAFRHCGLTWMLCMEEKGVEACREEKQNCFPDGLSTSTTPLYFLFTTSEPVTSHPDLAEVLSADEIECIRFAETCAAKRMRCENARKTCLLQSHCYEEQNLYCTRSYELETRAVCDDATEECREVGQDCLPDWLKCLEEKDRDECVDLKRTCFAEGTNFDEAPLYFAFTSTPSPSQLQRPGYVAPLPYDISYNPFRDEEKGVNRRKK